MGCSRSLPLLVMLFWYVPASGPAVYLVELLSNPQHPTTLTVTSAVFIQHSEMVKSIATF